MSTGEIVAGEPRPHPLATQQTARATLRAGERFVMEAEVRVTPLGLLAVGGLVAAILLSVPPIVQAAGRSRADRRLRSVPDIATTG